MTSTLRHWTILLCAGLGTLLVPALGLGQAGSNFEEPNPLPVCSPIGTDIAPRFDDFYAAKWGCQQAEVNEMWSAFDFDADDWVALGYDDPCNSGRPLGKTFNALQVLKLSPPDGATCDRNRVTNILDWGYCYAADAIDLETECAPSDAAAETASLIGNDCELMHAFFNAMTVVDRAATIIHEARHAEGPCMHDSDDCARGASCDESYATGCTGFASANGKGANGYEVDWLWHYIYSLRDKGGIEAELRQHAVDLANVLLDRAFNADPCFDIGPSGEYIYTCPVLGCESAGNTCF